MDDKDFMTDPQTLLCAFIYGIWIWRITSILTLSYSIAGKLTPSSASVILKFGVTTLLSSTSWALYLVPRDEFPRISLLNRIISIPSQIKTYYFLHHYVGCILDNIRVTALIYFIIAFVTIETVYMMSVDWGRIEPLQWVCLRVLGTYLKDNQNGAKYDNCVWVWIGVKCNYYCECELK